jgi:hypothetical protein
MGNLIDHARDELERIGEEPEVIDGYLRVVEAFGELTHQGQSVETAGPVIYALLQNKNLSPLTDAPEEWRFITNGVWQSTRNAEAFSSDAGKTYTLVSESGQGFLQRKYKTVKTSRDHRQ